MENMDEQWPSVAHLFTHGGPQWSHGGPNRGTVLRNLGNKWVGEPRSSHDREITKISLTRNIDIL